jgi:AraC family transcriptional regulator of adaptative response / DNA-3-methyladenine glycosylase II
MTQVAIASGFGCVRRFNATIFKTYQRTPTQIRRLARVPEVRPRNQYLFRLRFRPPYHWKGMLAFLGARAIPGVEVVDDHCYRRSIWFNGRNGYFEVFRDGRDPALVARVEFANAGDLFLIIERIRRMFDMNADWEAIAETLKTDPLLAGLVETNPGMRLPGSWDGFELAVRAILGQQITVKGASTLAGRLVRAFGQPFSGGNGLTHLFPTPEVLGHASLAGIGLTKPRALSIRSLARAVCRGDVCFEGIVDPDAFLARLSEVPGIGKWTAQYIAMRALAEPDAFPSGDIGFLRAVGAESHQEIEERAEAWRPWRAYAAIYLWSFANKAGVRGAKAIAFESSAVARITNNMPQPITAAN